jgi:hypothetical protein
MSSSTHSKKSITILDENMLFGFRYSKRIIGQWFFLIFDHFRLRLDFNPFENFRARSRDRFIFTETSFGPISECRSFFSLKHPLLLRGHLPSFQIF